jgi:HAD superfamily hydrolase (TIGR01509 family)
MEKNINKFRMNKIKNIIFDLGGVILNLDVPRTINAFDALGIKNIVNDTGHHYQHSFFYDFEIGQISEDTFLQSLSNISKKSNSFKEIKQAWNVMILDIPKDRIDFLQNLKEDYNLFLLSNTNSIHQKKYLTEFNEKYKFSLNTLFKKSYYSHEIGIRKPDAEIFNFVLKDSSLIADETLFIDDAISNTKSAELCKLKSLLITNNDIFETNKYLCKYLHF